MNLDDIQVSETARWIVQLIALIVPAVLICLTSRTWRLGILGMITAMVICAFCLMVSQPAYVPDPQIAKVPTEGLRVVVEAAYKSAWLTVSIIVNGYIAVFYCVAWAIVANVGRWVWRRFAHNRRASVAGTYVIGQ